MPRKQIATDCHVVVECRMPYLVDDTPANRKRICEDIAKDIRRHIDNLSSVCVITQTADVCEFCGERWTEEPNAPHNGGCCEQDEANMPEGD